MMIVLVLKLKPLNTRCSIHVDCCSCTALQLILSTSRSNYSLNSSLAWALLHDVSVLAANEKKQINRGLSVRNQGWSGKNQGLSIFRGHRPGACPWKIFSWSPDQQQNETTTTKRL